MKTLSVNESQLLAALLAQQKRTDGRRFTDMRNVQLEFGHSLGHAEVTLGKTRLVVQISAEVVKPYEDRPYEGLFHIATILSPMASPMFEAGRQSDQEARVTRLIEKAVRRSNALDLESLCITAGKACWMVRADVHYLDYDGGLVDATCIGVIAALLHFRRPDVSINGDRVVVHSVQEHAPVPLAILHVPICITFSFYSLERTEEEGETLTETSWLVDADSAEEALRQAEMTITVNKNRDLCQISKPGGLPVEAVVLMDCMNQAFDVAVFLTELIYKSLKDDDAIRNAGNQAVELSAENDR